MTARGGRKRSGLVAAAAVAAALVASDAAPAAKLPTPGTYRLQRILPPADAELLDAAGASKRFSEVAKGAITALAFFYGQCRDPSGCPLAWSTFETVRAEADADPLLKTRLRLVFVSLDPARDTVPVVRLLQEGEGCSASVPWVFFTAASEGALAPLLEAMGQAVGRDVNAAGAETGALNHMLKVFLIDPEGWAREIYSVAYLTPENLLNDARTLALEFPDADSGSKAR